MFNDPVFIIVGLIAYGVLCYVKGRSDEENKNECVAEIYGYNCRAGNPWRYPGGCDHSKVGVLEAKLTLARQEAEEDEK